MIGPINMWFLFSNSTCIVKHFQSKSKDLASYRRRRFQYWAMSIFVFLTVWTLQLVFRSQAMIRVSHKKVFFRQGNPREGPPHRHPLPAIRNPGAGVAKGVPDGPEGKLESFQFSTTYLYYFLWKKVSGGNFLNIGMRHNAIQRKSNPALTFVRIGCFSLQRIFFLIRRIKIWISGHPWRWPPGLHQGPGGPDAGAQQDAGEAPEVDREGLFHTGNYGGNA